MLAGPGIWARQATTTRTGGERLKSRFPPVLHSRQDPGEVVEGSKVKTFGKSALLAAIIAAILGIAMLAPAGSQASAANLPVLFGTTGACNNFFPGGPCTQTSTLVQLNPLTGTSIKEIGPVGYTVNGLAWDPKSQKMYASTAVGDVAFHGLITINLATGAGTPVGPTVHNFGLSGADAPVHSITINKAGRMVGWYDEFGTTDTFVKLDQRTGIATEFPNTGIDTSANGLSFDSDNLLWNIDTARRNGTTQTQVAYRLDPANGKPLLSVPLTPPAMAALGDFSPADGLYYGLNFNSFSTDPTFIEVVNLNTGRVTKLGQTVQNLHTLAFIKKLK